MDSSSNRAAQIIRVGISLGSESLRKAAKHHSAVYYQRGHTKRGACISEWSYMQVTIWHHLITKKVRHAEKFIYGTWWKQS